MSSEYLGKPLPVPETRLCCECQQPYTAYYSRSFICGKCRRKQENKLKKQRREELKAQTKAKKKADKKIEVVEQPEEEEPDVLAEIELAPTRHCHDCGKPTNNFRCDKCWDKWKIRHGISILGDNGENSGFDD